MFGNNLRKERIRDEARQEFDGKDEQLVNQLWDWTYLVFKKWKLEHGDRNPIPNRGMLSDLAPIPFDKAEPWECVDFMFSSPVALAMKLLRENYPPFDAVTAKVGIRKVLALAIVKSEHAADDDLLDAGEILHDYKTAEAMGKLVLNEHRDAIIAQQTRSPGGKIRGEQLIAGKEDKHRRIRDATKELSPTTKPRSLNKAIAKKTGLETDYVRKARKEMKQETGGS